MKFYNIDINLDPKITGRRNGSFAVEIKKNSFENNKHKEYFNSFFDSNSNDIKRVRIETFQQFDLKNCPNVIYFPMTKSIKKLDFVYYHKGLTLVPTPFPIFIIRFIRSSCILYN